MTKGEETGTNHEALSEINMILGGISTRRDSCKKKSYEK